MSARRDLRLEDGAPEPTYRDQALSLPKAVTLISTRLALAVSSSEPAGHATERRRACGGCVACCVVLDIGALDKPAGVMCPHLQAGGCGVYANRPATCRNFSCGWLAEDGWRDDERPDALGVMVAPAWAGSDFARTTGASHLVAYELRPGALDSWKAERLLKRLARRRLVALMPYGWEDGDREPARWRGPAKLLADVKAFDRRS